MKNHGARVSTIFEKHFAKQTVELEKGDEVLEDHLRFELMISNLSTIFMNAPPEKLDDEIEPACKLMCHFFKADRCSFMEVLTDDRPREILNVEMALAYPWAYCQLIEKGEPVIFSSLETLPEEANLDRTAWERDGIQAMLMLPLRLGERVTHLIGLSSDCIGHEWPLIQILRLRVMGENLAKTQAHKRILEALPRRKRDYVEAQGVDQLGIWDWDIVDGIHHWSEELYRILGLLPQNAEASYETFIASVHPNDRHAVEQANKESISGLNKPYSIEYKVVRPDGTQRVVHAGSTVLFNQNRKAARMIVTLQDITGHKNTEVALKKAFDEIKKLRGQLATENIYLREEVGGKDDFNDIIGVSDSIKYVKHRIRQVTHTKASVLLTGETGTGKGVFARSIHELSGRKNKPFVHINCASLPPNLIESELFGREKGAFTGSIARQIGRIEFAKDGTLFLDEIGELQLELQPKLLKVLESEEFERLGSPYPVKADVRIVASTNRDLLKECRQGRFRMDLFYRLNVFPITIPPLRQRTEDIPLLINFFINKFNKRYRKDIGMIPKSTMKVLKSYDWPGNVRELISVIERAVIVSNGPVLRLSEQIDAKPSGLVQEKMLNSVESREPKNLFEAEREYILRALMQTGWKISGAKGAAQLLELNANTLRSRLKKLGIKRPEPITSNLA